VQTSNYGTHAIRACVEVTWQDRSKRGSGNRRRRRSNCAGQRRAEQRHAQEEYGGKLLREMQERDDHIENTAQVLDEMPIRVMLENARVVLLGEASKVQDAIGRILRQCADATRQG
jgi:hypothetical protein